MGCDLGKDGKNEVAREEACQEDAPESKKKNTLTFTTKEDKVIIS